MRKLWVFTAVAFIALAISATATAKFTPQLAILNGTNEVPVTDLDGFGYATLGLDAASGKVCWNIRVDRIGPVVAAHIHNAPAGVNGPVVIDFFGQLIGCTFASPVLVEAINLAPQNYYVNVHTIEFPGGAVRGQLGTIPRPLAR